MRIPIPYLEEIFYSNGNNLTRDEQESGKSITSCNEDEDDSERVEHVKSTTTPHYLSRLVIIQMVTTLAFFVFCGHKLFNKAPQFVVESASMYPIQFDPVSNPLNISMEYRLTAGWNISFTVTNPSKNHILSYSNIAATIYYKETPLCVTMIPGFHQPEKGRDIVYATFAAEPVIVDLPLAVSMLDDINSGSSSTFSINLSGNLRRKSCKREKDEALVGKKCEKDEASPLVDSCKFYVVFSQQESGLQGSV